MVRKVFLYTLFFLFSTYLKAQTFDDVTYLFEGEIMHSYSQLIDEMPLRVSGGAGVADVNNDNYNDVLLSLGDNQSLKLLINENGKSFSDQTFDFGLSALDFRTSSPHFFNCNNDEYIDLIVGSVDGTPPMLFINIEGREFEKVELPQFGILQGVNTITITSIDFDNDGLIDLFFSHWLEDFEANHFWKNMGNGQFQSFDEELEFYSPHEELDFTHTASFLDINDDGFDDLLLCSDFETSQIWFNEQGSKFVLQNQYELGDENAMGSAIADFDNDGDFDWFISSVHDDDGVLEGNWGGTGNKFYINDGHGGFTEEADFFAIDDASWAWGSSFADLDNDGFQDLVIVNGWPQGSDQFKNDELKIFMSVEGQYFHESSFQFGIKDTLQGRGLSILDFDNDGLLDFLVSNYRGPAKLYKNNLKNDNHYIKLNLWESIENPQGIGTKVSVYCNDKMMTQKLMNASNYVSQNQCQFHFGLGNATQIDSVLIEWNDGLVTKMFNIKADRVIDVKRPNNHINLSTSFHVYPVPAIDQISLVLDRTLSNNSQLTIIDCTGKKVIDKLYFYIFNNKTYSDNIDLRSLSPGKYYIVSNTNNLKINIPFIKN